MQKEENIKELLKKLENGATEDQKKLIKKIGNELDIWYMLKWKESGKDGFWRTIFKTSRNY